MKTKVLYFHTGKSSFVLKDIDILKINYNVVDFLFDTNNKKRYWIQIIRQLYFILFNIFSARLVVCQFAGHHSFFPILFSNLLFKKSVVVAGGTDCVSFPSIRYGNFNNRFLSFTTAFSLKSCDLILPVHQSLVEYDYYYQPNDYKKQGYKYFVPNIKTPYQVIPNGYDAQKWFCDTEKESNSFVTIGAGLDSRFGFKLKGIDLIFEIAEKFPDCIFYVIGGFGIRYPAPSNVKLLDKIPNHELRAILSKMRFYLQLSMSEGFPNALSEAMLCECVPIVSNVGGMPDMVSNNGFILHHKNLTELSDILNKALHHNHLYQIGKQARERITENYTYNNRKEQLLSAIDQLI